MVLLPTLYQALWQAGEAFDIRDFGLYAMDSLRLDKCYRGWKSDLEIGFTPFEASLDRFCDVKKPNFIGRDAVLAEQARGIKQRFVPMILDSPGDADAPFCAPIFHGDDNVGIVTSGGWSFTLNASVALGYVRSDLAHPGTKLTLSIYGARFSATVCDEPLFDPTNSRLRS
jgi:dimethylglycine dehydrogenase